MTRRSEGPTYRVPSSWQRLEYLVGRLGRGRLQNATLRYRGLDLQQELRRTFAHSSAKKSATSIRRARYLLLYSITLQIPFEDGVRTMSCKRAPDSLNSVEELKKCWTSTSSPSLNANKMKSPTEPKPAASKLDSLREHELFRYFQPPTENVTANAASSPDTTLTALAQLCALRLNAKRAMISVLDREKQYFIAESTKTLNLLDNEKFEAEGDELWFGCGVVDKAGRLCEKTVELPPIQGRTSCFTVTDLSKDEAFNQLPFVTGPPYFKYYAGTVSTPHTLKRITQILTE